MVEVIRRHMENSQPVCLPYYCPTPKPRLCFPASDILKSQEEKRKAAMKSWQLSKDILKDKERCLYLLLRRNE